MRTPTFILATTFACACVSAAIACGPAENTGKTIGANSFNSNLGDGDQAQAEGAKTTPATPPVSDAGRSDGTGGGSSTSDAGPAKDGGGGMYGDGGKGTRDGGGRHGDDDDHDDDDDDDDDRWGGKW